MSGFIESRKRQLVKHFLKPDKILKKFIPVVGQISALLGGVSVLLGRDVDLVGEIIDKIVDPIVSKIPVVGEILVSEEGEVGQGDSSSGARNIEFSAYAQHGKNHSSHKYSLTYDRLKGSISVPDSVEIEGGSGEYNPNEVRWIEAETGDNLAFNVEWDPVDKTYRIDDYSEEQLEEKGVLRSKHGHHARKSIDFLSDNPVPGLSVRGISLIVVSLLALAIVPTLVGGSPAGQWLDYGGTQAADRVLVPMDIGPQLAMFQQGFARISCYAEGPDCYQEWQMNNTQRPDSNNVGQQYGLSIDSFEVGQGGSVDVAYNDPSREVPVSFTVSNTRRGLNGVNAYDVNYRMRMIDSQGEYCETEWQPVNGYDMRENFDSQSDRFRNTDNDLFPGASVSVFESSDEFTLEECRMVQTGLGDFRTVVLELEYDYSSLADIQFEAMSRQTLQTDETVTISEKNSQTADTPAKAALQVNEPVLFDEERLGDENAPQPFALRATVNTDEFDVEYKIQDFVVTKSEFIEPVNRDESSCQFDFNGNRMTVTRDNGVINNIIQQGSSDRTESYYWFDTNRNPPIIGCPMQLDPDRLDEISSTGTTLEASVDVNYTVRLEDNMDNFESYNSACGTYPCPMLVTAEFAGSNSIENDPEEGLWRTECTGNGASRGCSVMEGEDFGQQYNRIDLGEYIGDGPVRENERAVDAVSNNLLHHNGQLNEEWFEDNVDDDIESGKLALGLNENDRNYILNNIGWAILAEGSGRLVTLGEEECDIDQEYIMFSPPEECDSFGETEVEEHEVEEDMISEQ